VRGHPARVPHFSAQHFLFRLHFPARNHAQLFLRHQFFRSRQLLHQHHSRHHSARRRPAPALARRLGTVRHGRLAPDRCCPPLPEKSHHGVSSIHLLCVSLNLPSTRRI